VIAKAIKRRFGLHARRVQVQTAWFGYLRWMGLAFAGVALGFFAWIAYSSSDQWDISIGTKSALKEALAQKAALEKENAALRSELAVTARELQIERASQAELAKQVKAMAGENARLKEDAALVQAVSGADAKVDGIKVSTARVQAGAVAGEYSYRIVLLQTGPRKKPFQGSYQLVVNLNQNGAGRGVMLPEPSEQGTLPYKLDFRVSQRVDGTFRVDPGAVVKSVQIRVFEGRQTQPKVMQTVTLS
jgi:hypothetical protein